MDLKPLLLSTFLVATQAQGQTVDCSKLGPDRKITTDFLMQFHGPEDAFSNRLKTLYPDPADLKAVSHLFNHLLAHGVPKEKMINAMKACNVSNVNTPG